MCSQENTDTAVLFCSFKDVAGSCSLQNTIIIYMSLTNYNTAIAEANQ